jgi:flagellar basal body-associated protein FliL
MAKCVHCDYPYATGNKCSNCGSDNPSGKSSSKGGGIIGIIILIIIIYAIANSGGSDNSSSTNSDTDTTSSQAVDNTASENSEKIEEKKSEDKVSVNTSDEIPDSGTATAKSSIAYFYEDANYNTRVSKYIVKGQEVQFLRKNGDFMYVNFTYENIFTEGWMLISDFENFRSNEIY